MPEHAECAALNRKVFWQIELGERYPVSVPPLERLSVCLRGAGKKRPPPLARGRFSPALLRHAHGIGALVASLVAINGKPFVALVAQGLVWLLLVVHAGLGLWAVVGAIELISASVLLPGVTNPELPRWLLWLRWPLIGAACGVFIAGYSGRWRHTPRAMLIIYAAMAAMCAYETFFVLSNPSRYRAMAIEYSEYAIILLFLFRSQRMQEHFARAPRSSPRAER